MSEAVTQRLNMELSDVVGREVPGVSVAVATRAGVQWSTGVGVADLSSRAPATTATIYLWFSMTKIVTATAVMQLVDRGLLELDHPVADLVPALAGATYKGNRVRITLRHLLSHTSGLANPIPVGWVHGADMPRPDEDTFADHLLAKHTRLKFEPGARTSYSNLNYLALGRAIASVSGLSYTSYIRERLLQPLEMTSTDFMVRDPSLAATGYQPRWNAMTLLLPLMLPRGLLGHSYGRYIAFHPFYVNGAAYGGLVGSVADAARFAALHLNGGTIDSTRVLSEKSVAKMQHLSATGPDLDIGLGWFRKRSDSLRGETFVEHLGGGAGYFNVMRLYPDKQTAIVVMGNTTTYNQGAVIKAALDA